MNPPHYGADIYQRDDPTFRKPSRLSTIIISSAAASWLHSAGHFTSTSNYFAEVREWTRRWPVAGVTGMPGYLMLVFAQHRRREIFNPVVDNQWRLCSEQYWLLCVNAIQRFVLPPPPKNSLSDEAYSFTPPVELAVLGDSLVFAYHLVLQIMRWKIWLKQAMSFSFVCSHHWQTFYFLFLI